MPIGKNSIKRVSNNGYSKVESKAPDMENSTVIVPDAQTVKLVENMVSDSSAKKASAKGGAKAASAKTAAKSDAKTASAKAAKSGAKSTAAKTAAKSAPKAKGDVTEKVKESSVATAKDGDKSYVNLGDKMPDYLL